MVRITKADCLNYEKLHNITFENISNWDKADFPTRLIGFFRVNEIGNTYIDVHRGNVYPFVVKKFDEYDSVVLEKKSFKTFEEALSYSYLKYV